MLATFIEDQLTPWPFEKAAEALRWAIASHSSAEARDEVTALGLAKMYLETRRLKSIHRNNPGNAKAGPKFVGNYTAFRCGENLRDSRESGHLIKGDVEYHFYPDGMVVIPSTKQVFHPKRFRGPPHDDWHPQTRFRAYANVYDGCDAYVRLLIERFPNSWKALLLGDSTLFGVTLHQERYYTAPVKQYTTPLRSIQTEIELKLKGLAADVVEIDWEDLVRRVQFTHYQLLDGAAGNDARTEV